MNNMTYKEKAILELRELKGFVEQLVDEISNNGDVLPISVIKINLATMKHNIELSIKELKEFEDE